MAPTATPRVVLLLIGLACAGVKPAAGEVTGAYNVPPQPVSTRVFDVRDYGAVGDGQTKNTAAFAAAIADASSAGGGLVTLRAGRYLTGPVVLASRVYLNVEGDAVLLGSADRADYGDPATARMVSAVNATDTGIVGGGVLDGQAVPMFIDSYSRAMDQLEPITWTDPPYNCTGECRPRLVTFERCSRVLVRDVTLQNSPDWTSHYVGCVNVLVDNVTVHGDYRWPNCDGIDPDSTVNMTIRDSYVNTGDDAVCPKAASGYGQGLSNLLVERVIARSRSSAFKIGSTTDEDVTGILVRDFYVWDSNRGLAIQHRDGGAVRDITFDGVIIDGTARQPTTWWGAGEAIWVTSTPRTAGHPLGPVSGVHFNNVTVRRAENTALISALGSPTAMSDVTFTDVQYVVDDAWRPMRTQMDFTPPEHDYRPAAPTSEVPCGSGKGMADCDGFYFENVRGASIDAASSFTFSGAADAPGNGWWGAACVGHDASSSGITVAGGFTCTRGTA